MYFVLVRTSRKPHRCAATREQFNQSVISVAILYLSSTVGSRALNVDKNAERFFLHETNFCPVC